ncbi:hypothetical protein PAXINDRAFT_171867, partial [Paxillus involutus ATCC 200175]
MIPINVERLILPCSVNVCKCPDLQSQDRASRYNIGTASPKSIITGMGDGRRRCTGAFPAMSHEVARL